jgi:Uma2 family endonuclease
MTLAARQRFTFQDYLSLEDIAAVRHEFLEGEVWAMAGGTPEHAAVCVNISTLLSNATRGRPCRVFSSDLRVRVLQTGLGTYPDVTVVCGALEVDAEDSKGRTVSNPRILVEVLSPSTEDYDRGEKLGHYKRIVSLEEVLLVAHDRREIEVVRREADGSWSRHIAGAGESVRLAAFGIDISVDEVYRDPLADTSTS